MVYLVGFLLACLFSFSKAQVISQWTPFSDCSASCNFNNPVRTRTRTCTPANLCQSVSLFDTTPCNTEFACPDYRLGDWGTWSACSASCRLTQSNPVRVRVRDYCLSNSSSLYQCTADFMVNYEPCNTAACPVVRSCSNLNITFVIVLDSSSSVDDLSWSQEKGFATSFIANSELGVNPNVQVAVVNFASRADIASPCGALTNKNDFINFMTTLPRINGGTAINYGLLKAREAYRGCQRLNVAPVVLFLTDVVENIEPSYATRVQTEDLVKSEALLFVGAIGPDVNPTDINRMSNYVVNGSDVYYNRFAKNFSELASIKAEEFYPLVLGKLQCEGKGLWTEWGAWSSCSFTCGATGFQRRERLCQNPTTLNIQEDCDSDGNIAKYELRICSAQCRAFSEWTNWASCSASCRPESGPPTTSRSRKCDIGLGSCVGLYSETQECNTNTQCPGDLTEWSAFSACSQSCQIGSIPPTTKRVRKCINTSLGGNCNGQPLEENKVCNFETPCPGQLTEWTLWSSCPATCQPAVNVYLKQYRSRECQNTSFFANCSGERLVDETVCVKDVPCPGILKEWSSWSLCTASCRNDILTIPTRTKTRLCDAATLNGNCGGVPLVTNEACNENVGCPGTWTNWGPFTECSESCQSNAVVVPTRSRQRFCVNNTLNGTCPSEDGLGKLQTLECNAGVICPIRGTWNTWGAWSECSASCDAGITQRARNCSTPWPSDAGDDCVGDIVQKAPCKLFDCPRVCMTPKRCSCSQAAQWNYVPTFDQFQNEGITLEVINEVMSYLMIYDEETVNQTCEVCDKMILDSMKSQLTNHMMQVNLTLVKLKAIKENLRDVINCNQMLQNYSGLWELYDLIFERGVMLDGILIEMQAIYIRFEAASTSCESYGWFHQVVSSILRKTN